MRKKEEDRDEEKSKLPTSDEINRKEGFHDIETLPSTKQVCEIMDEIIRNYNANTKDRKIVWKTLGVQKKKKKKVKGRRAREIPTEPLQSYISEE